MTMTRSPRPADDTSFEKVGEREIRIERVFDAPRARVWRAFTDPEEVAQWWGRGNRMTIERMDVVPGGHWRYVEHTSDAAYGFEGRYRVVDSERRLEQTFEWDGAPGHVLVQAATFEDAGAGRTRVITVCTYMTAEDLDAMSAAGMKGGMIESYAALDALLARA
jgi:uncharacterized protein YndB with AHSA1/START domain